MSRRGHSLGGNSGVLRAPRRAVYLDGIFHYSHYRTTFCSLFVFPINAFFSFSYNWACGNHVYKLYV